MVKSRALHTMIFLVLAQWLCLIGYSLYQLNVIEQEARHSYQLQLEATEKRLSNTLPPKLWNYAYEFLKMDLKHEFLNSNISYLSLLDTHGELVYEVGEGRQDDADNIIELELNYNHLGDMVFVGTLSIHIETYLFGENLQQSIEKMRFEILILVLVMSFITIFVGWFLLKNKIDK